MGRHMCRHFRRHSRDDMLSGARRSRSSYREHEASELPLRSAGSRDHFGVVEGVDLALGRWLPYVCGNQESLGTLAVLSDAAS